MTNHWIDLKNSDVILIMGANPAENHPISFKWITKAMENGATLLSVDPRFTRTSAKADHYAPIRSGSDIAFLGGLIKYILDNELYHREYIVEHTNAPFLINPDFSFEEGIFSGYDADKRAPTASRPGPTRLTTRAFPWRIPVWKILTASSNCSSNTMLAMIWRQCRRSRAHPSRI